MCVMCVWDLKIIKILLLISVHLNNLNYFFSALHRRRLFKIQIVFNFKRCRRDCRRRRHHSRYNTIFAARISVI